MTWQPPPGIYEDVPFETYLSWPYLSNSRLSSASTSMAHFNAATPIEETKSMRFGTLCHAGKLDPLSVPLNYVVMPAFEQQVMRDDGTPYANPKNTNAYRALVAEFTQANAEKLIVSRDEYEAMVSVVRSLTENDRACEYLNGRGPVEVSIVWDDPDTGLRCKGRLDKWVPGKRRISDLKTTRDPLRFESTIWSFGYHRQGAMYLDGMTALGELAEEVCLIAVENAAPWLGVRAAPLSEELIDIGRQQYKQFLRQIAECRKSNTWPGFDSPAYWCPPSYADIGPVSLTFGGAAIDLDF